MPVNHRDNVSYPQPPGSTLPYPISLQLNDGTVSDPSLYFESDAGTGLSYGNPGVVVSDATAEVLRIDANELNSASPLIVAYNGGQEQIALRQVNGQPAFIMQMKSDGAMECRQTIDAPFRLVSRGSVDVQPTNTTDQTMAFNIRRGDGAAALVDMMTVDETTADVSVPMSIKESATQIGLGVGMEMEYENLVTPDQKVIMGGSVANGFVIAAPIKGAFCGSVAQIRGFKFDVAADTTTLVNSTGNLTLSPNRLNYANPSNGLTMRVDPANSGFGFTQPGEVFFLNSTNPDFKFEVDTDSTERFSVDNDYTRCEHMLRLPTYADAAALAVAYPPATTEPGSLAYVTATTQVFYCDGVTWSAV